MFGNIRGGENEVQWLASFFDGYNTVRFSHSLSPYGQVLSFFTGPFQSMLYFCFCPTVAYSSAHLETFHLIKYIWSVPRKYGFRRLELNHRKR